MGFEQSKRTHTEDKFQSVYAKAASENNSSPRTSIFKFGNLAAFGANIGILLAQSMISWFLTGVLAVFLYLASTDWVSDQTALAIYELTKLVCFTISVFLITKVTEEDGLNALGIKKSRRAFLDFSIGFVVIVYALGMQFLFLLMIGSIELEYISQGAPLLDLLGYILLTLLIFCFVGWSEELLSRGFHLRIIAKGLNRPLGIIISSVIFSYLHRNNEGITFTDLVFHFFFGVLCCFATIRTGQLWLAIGLHAGWDFFVVLFWGSSISDLNIFNLFSVNVYIEPIIYRFMQFAIYLFAGVLIMIYTNIHKRTEELTW